MSAKDLLAQFATPADGAAPNVWAFSGRLCASRLRGLRA